MKRILQLILVSPLIAQQPVVDYDIVYVRAPRFGDTQYARLPEVFDPIKIEPGADLMLLHPNGSEEVLFPGGNGSVVDPALSFDAQWVYFSYFPDLRAGVVNYQRRNAPPGGADIYKMNLATRQVIRLTNQEWTPPGGPTKWSADPLRATSAGSYYLGYGIFNLGPCPLPDGRVMFTSSRDSYFPNKDFTFPNLRLYIMDEDGKNVEQIGHLNIGSALHPTVLTDGRVMFSSYEAQGLRDNRVWGLWALWPDGRKWEPLFSAFTEAAAMHFQTQLSDGRVAVTEYYNLNNNGYGTVLAFPSNRPAPFGSPNPFDLSNPLVRRGLWWLAPGHEAHLTPRYKQYPFSPPGLVALSGFTHGEDEASSRASDGTFAGKVTHPSGAPDNDMLVSYSPGPANSLNRPTTIPWYDGGIYVLKSGVAITDHTRLVRVKNDSRYNEIHPRAVVPYSRIYGVPRPAALAWLPNDGSGGAQLPAGTPFGLVGTSTFYKRNTSPGKGVARFAGLDPFNSTENGPSSNWWQQGSDAGRYSNSDIWAVRIVAMEGVAVRSYGPRFYEPGFRAHSAAERLRILGEIPLRKAGVTDPEGNPDTSFLARIPADTPFTFQTLDKDGMVLNTAQTWHQVRPGETRTDCGGCHAHSQQPLDFAQTAAGRGGYAVHQLIDKTPLLAKDSSGNTIVREAARRLVDVEYYRDIKPILQRSCVPCHTKNATPPAGLVLDDTSTVEGFEGTWHRLANDEAARYGIKPVIASRTWRQMNVSRYVRAFQSRRSLLVWKILGRRTDGWTNGDHPTESVPGDPATLPQGANANDADLDFTGTIMPPPTSGVPALSEDDKLAIIRWIDLGCPISSQDPELSNWFADELKPTLTVSSPRAGANSSLSMIRVGMYDSYSGLDRASFSVKASFAVNGKAAGTELAPDFTEQSGQYIWTLPLASPATSLANATITVKVKDNANNWQTIERTFSAGSGGGDTVAPAVSITAPAAGAIVNGLVSLTALASDNIGVAGVQFLVDGAAVGAEDTAAPYQLSWNSAAVADGSHRIAARARDAAGNRATSAEISIVVRNAPADTVPPSVSITEPAAGAIASGGLTLKASASDNVRVAGVQFLVDGNAVGAEDTAAPFELAWNSTSVASGAHLISARARDSAGNVATSNSVRILIHNFEGLAFSRSFDDQTAAGRYCAGVTRSLSVSDPPEARLSNAMTISAWVRPDALAGPSPVLVKERPGGISYALYATTAESKPAASIVNTGAADIPAQGGMILPAGAWTHLAATYDGARLTLYVNGASVRSVAASGPLSSGAGALHIGANPARGESFRGVIDEVRVYSRALSDLELRADINRRISASCATPLDTAPPAVSLTAPANNSAVGPLLRVSATASDAFGVREVQFWADGRQVIFSRTTPYMTVFSTASWTRGPHTLVAVAIDAAGNRAQSAAVTVVK